MQRHSHNAFKVKLKMALKALFPSVACFLVSCVAKQNNREVKCKVFSVGKDVATEFRSKASEDGVRLVYLNLKMGNESYRPLELQDEFLPEKWVWASSITEPMLSFPFDYDILSLGILNFQVRSMTVQLQDKPAGCLSGLNSSYQNMVVGRALLDNVHFSELSGGPTAVVCVAMIMAEKVEEMSVAWAWIEYYCCSRLNATQINCDLPVSIKNTLGVGRGWFDQLELYFSLIFIFYWPALLLAIPDCVFNLRYECDREDRINNQMINNGRDESSQTRNGYEQITDQNEEEGRPLEGEQIPVDDSSPISLSSFAEGCVQQLSDLKLSFNVKLALLECFILPFVFYLHEGIYFTLKQNYLKESLSKSPSGATLTGFSQPPVIVKQDTVSTAIFASLLAFTVLMSVLFSRPMDFQVQMAIPCKLCQIASARFPQLYGGCYDSGSRENTYLMGDEMLHHLKVLQEWLCLWMTFPLRSHMYRLKIPEFLSSPSMNYQITRRLRALKVLRSFISILGGVILAAILLILYLVTSYLMFFICSPVFLWFNLIWQNLLQCLLQRRLQHMNSSRRKLLLTLFVLPLAWYALLYFLVTTSLAFILAVLEFTVIGLVLNADILAPYASFTLVVATNLYLC